VPCFTMVDDTSIGADMGRDPAEGTPRVVNVEDVSKYAAAADRKL
jgi:adenine phosphoribosyltransferase